MKKRCVLFILCMMFLVGCSEQNEEIRNSVIEESTETESSLIIEEETEENNVQIEPVAPTKEEVFAMREKVLDGMTDDEKERLTENIKVANLQMERAYLNDGIFDKLEDKDSLAWNYFDQKGDIQVGWAYDSNKITVMNEEGITESEFYQKYGKPVMVYNRFDGANFVNLIQDMQKSIHNEELYADLQRLIDLTNLATETHEMEYANDIYKILHDMDYFLLRYGIEDVGKYIDQYIIMIAIFRIIPHSIYCKIIFIHIALISDNGSPQSARRKGPRPDQSPSYNRFQAPHPPNGRWNNPENNSVMRPA